MRRMSIPLKVFAAMALAVCALLVSFELTSGFAYGSSDSDGGGTKTSASLTTASRSTVYDIGKKSCTCDDPNTEYTIVGTSMKGSTVKIKGGNAQNPIRVTLDNVTIDQGQVNPSDAPITVESGHAIIKLRETNVLKAGYKNVFLLNDWGFAGLCVQKGAVCETTFLEKANRVK